MFLISPKLIQNETVQRQNEKKIKRGENASLDSKLKMEFLLLRKLPSMLPVGCHPS